MGAGLISREKHYDPLVCALQLKIYRTSFLIGKKELILCQYQYRPYHTARHKWVNILITVDWTVMIL